MNRKLTLLTATFLFISLFALSGGNKPLSLKKSTPEEGADGVLVDVVIELEFSNNVINLSVQENNREAFTLMDGDGNALSFDVIFPDDQLEPEKKRQIYIDPVEDLMAGNTYTLEVAETLQSKNGQHLQDPVSLTFSTAE